MKIRVSLTAAVLLTSISFLYSYQDPTVGGAPGEYLPVDLWRAEAQVGSAADGVGTANTSSFTHDIDVDDRDTARTRAPGTPTSGTARQRQYPITGCTDLTKPGYYYLRNDIADGPRIDCLRVVSSNVTIQCDGHTVSAQDRAISAINVKNLKILNCQIPENHGLVYAKLVKGIELQGNSLDHLEFVQVSSGIITNNVLGPANGRPNRAPSYTTMTLEDSDHFQIADNEMYGGLHLRRCNYMTMSSNKAEYIEGGSWYAFRIVDGHHNEILHNTVDGKWFVGKQGEYPAFDNAVLTWNEDYDVIRGNTVKNTFNSVFEHNGTLTNTLIEDNEGSNNWMCGIAAYNDVSWRNNIVRNNNFSQAQTFSWILYDPGVSTFFENNLFEGNTFRQRSEMATSALIIRFVPNGSNEAAEGVSVRDNVVRRNDFSRTAAAPCLRPLKGFTDEDNIVGRVFENCRP